MCRGNIDAAKQKNDTHSVRGSPDDSNKFQAACATRHDIGARAYHLFFFNSINQEHQPMNFHRSFQFKGFILSAAVAAACPAAPAPAATVVTEE